jgi:hypothetical protein
VLLFINRPAFNRRQYHLVCGMGVLRLKGCDLGDTFGTFGDNNKLDNNKIQKTIKPTKGCFELQILQTAG